MLIFLFVKYFTRSIVMARIAISRPRFPSGRKTYYLSEAENKSYSENGYLIIKKLFDQQTLDSFIQRFEAIWNEKSMCFSIIKGRNLCSTNPNPEDHVYKIQGILDDEVFMRYSEDPCLLHVVSQFIGEELTAFNCMFINKPPGTARHPAHQDAYYLPFRPMTALASWTAVDPATVDNGCLYVLPGSHKMELLPHGVFEDSKKFFHSIVDEAAAAPAHRRVYLEMEPGDTVFFPPYLVHGAGANHSKRHCKAISMHIMNSGCEFIDLRGTPQESVVKDFELKVQRNGLPESYQAMWKFRSKVVKNASCHL